MPNRFVKSATFEGMARHNVVTDDLVDFHRAMATGGVGTTTLAYCAVSWDGRGAPNEIVMRPDAAEGLRRLVDTVHAAGAAAGIQLGHAGPVGTAVGGGGLAPSRIFAPQALRFTRPATGEDLHRIVGDFRSAAALAVECGFDVVELHFGHGYLVSAFLSPRLNRRHDEWGGPLENRARLARRIATEVREQVGDRCAVTAKLNMADGVAGGLWLDESVEVARLLAADGALDALELTGGSSFENPMFLFRGDAPVAEMAEMFPGPLKWGFRLAGGRYLKTYPFEEAYFLPYARQFLAAVDLPLILLGGITRLETVHAALAEGFAFVALGRALLREPELIARWRDGDTRDSLCVHCNVCMPTIYRGTHCVLVPPDERPGHRRPS